MLFFLQIIGGVVLAVIALIILGYAWYRIRYGKWVDILDNDNEPLQIHLNQDYSPNWLERGDAATHFAELKRCGFEPGKAYTVVEMDGIKMQSLFRPPFIATLALHPLAGAWVDISFDAKDRELEIDVSNAAMGETIRSRPETKKIYRKGARVAALLDVMKQEVGDLPGKLINDSNYREHVEASYRKDMIWRCEQGGISFDEFIATASAGDKKFKESQIKEAFIETKLREFHRWHEAAMERIDDMDNAYLDSVYEKGNSVFVLPHSGNVEAFIRYIGDYGVIDEAQAESMVATFSGQSDLQMVVRRIFEGISGDLRPKKLRDIDFPVSGELYEFSW